MDITKNLRKMKINSFLKQNFFIWPFVDVI